MRNYKKYRSTVINLFQPFLAGEIDKAELHDNLHVIQDVLGYNKSRSLKCVWFKFSKDDTLATTINNLYFNIDCPTNGKHIRECMQIAIDNPKGLQIYYS